MKYIIRRFVGGWIELLNASLTILTLGFILWDLDFRYASHCSKSDCKEAKKKLNKEKPTEHYIKERKY